MKNIVQRIEELESKDIDSTKSLESRISKLEDIIESLGYYIPNRRK